MQFKTLTNLALLTLLMCALHPVFATQDHTGIWLDASAYDHLLGTKNFSYSVEGQLRLRDSKDYYELYYLQGDLGYQYYKQRMSFWAGYEWVSSSPLDNTSAQNIFFEEMYWKFFSSDKLVMRNRFRFEQIKTQHESEWENRFRDKYFFHFTNLISDKITPVIYNEIFIKLNDPSWDATDAPFQQNWFFVGTDIVVSKKWFIEVGYLQQYVFGKKEDQINNILYVGINFNPLMVPVYDYIR